MSSVARCLREIDRIRNVARGVDAAYVARSRLNRLILKVARLACEAGAMPPPDRPARLVQPVVCSDELRELITTCNQLLDRSKTITQPSEPLDDRWRQGWADLLADLLRLETSLLRLGET
jgi:hypothetical protein